WSWTGTTWSQISATTSPTLRAGASLAYDASSSQMVLFGGYNGSSYLQDTWTWSGTTWTALAPAAKPSAREESSFGYDTSTSQMILFGGYASNDLADTLPGPLSPRQPARRRAMARQSPTARR